MASPETEFRALYPREHQRARDIVAVLYRRARCLERRYKRDLESAAAHRDILVTLSLTNWNQARNAAIVAHRVLLGQEP